MSWHPQPPAGFPSAVLGKGLAAPALLVHDQSNLLGQIQIEAAGNLPSAEKLFFPKKSNSCPKKSPLFLLPGSVTKAPTINAEKLIKGGELSIGKWGNKTLPQLLWF